MSLSPRALRRAAEHAARKAAYRQSKIADANQPEAKPEAQDAAQPEARPESRIASPAQIAANQANARLSTGPITIEGKAISARNHTSHGLTVEVTGGPFKVLLNEDQSEYDRYLAEFQAEWKPATATEHDLVERMVTHFWLRRRAHRLQDQLLAQGMHEPADYKHFEVFSRYYNTHLRAFNKALADLIRLRNFQMRQKKDEAMLERRAQDAQIRFESQKRKSEEHAAKMETIRLKQEAQKQRISRSKPAQTTPAAVETALLQAA